MTTQRRSGDILLQQSARFIARISSAPVLIGMVLLSALFPMVLFPAHGIGDIGVLDLHLSYTPDQAYEHLAALGVAGRSAYLRMALSSDLVFPVSYALTLSIAFMLFLRKLSPSPSRFRYLGLFPFLIVIIDWCENLSLAFITGTFPARADTIARFASFFTSLKWALVVSTVLLLLAVVTYWAASVIRSK